MSLVVKTLATSDGETKLASDERWTPWCWAWKAKCHWHAARRTLPGPSVSLARRMLGDLARVFFDSDCFYNGILETCSFGWFIWFFSGVSHYVSVCGEVSHCPFLHTSFSLTGPQSLGKKLIAQLRIAEVCFLSIFTVATCPCWTHAHSCTSFTATTWWTWIEMDRNGGLITRPKDVIDVTANPKVVWCSLLRKFFKWNTAVLRRFCWDWLHVDGSLA